MRSIAAWLLLVIVGIGCGEGKTKKISGQEDPKVELPFLGPPILQERPDGKGFDSLPYQIPDFAFVNQDSLPYTQDSVEGKVYLADFFFTTCPTICPKMSFTMELVQERMMEEPDFRLLSHSIDPLHDQPSVLKSYAEKHHAAPGRWQFLTGEVDSIFLMADAYMAYAKKAPEEPGGYTHSGFLILVDQNRHIRAVFDGTRSELADSIAHTAKLLLHP